MSKAQNNGPPARSARSHPGREVPRQRIGFAFLALPRHSPQVASALATLLGSLARDDIFKEARLPPLAPSREKAKAEKGVEQSKKGRATFCGGRSSPKKACATVGTFLTGVTQGGRPPWGVFLITFWAPSKSNCPPGMRAAKKRTKKEAKNKRAGVAQGAARPRTLFSVCVTLLYYSLRQRT